MNTTEPDDHDPVAAEAAAEKPGTSADEMANAPDEVAAEAINAQPGLAEVVEALRDHVAWLTDRFRQLQSEDKKRRHEPADWVVFTPPAAAGPAPHQDEGPAFTITNFVAWYNITYTGLPGSRSRTIPECWPHHPGLASEIATLAYSWQHAFTGKTAEPRDAQLWHHRDRPGFAERLSSEWTHPHCHDYAHKQAGAPSRRDRHGLNGYVNSDPDGAMSAAHLAESAKGQRSPPYSSPTSPTASPAVRRTNLEPRPTGRKESS